MPEKCPKCGCTHFEQEKDVLDTWFSSALWPFSTLGWPQKTPDFEKFYPNDVLVTGFDIIFFWVARMIFSGIEYCGEVDGIKFYNDSKGTNTDATITALKALKKNIILLAGGDAKKQDFAPLAAELSGKVKHMMLYGRDASDIKEAADAAGFNSYTMVKNLEEATNLAFEMAQPGDAVLLSPACASWDMYSNFEQRGDHFKILVERLGR